MKLHFLFTLFILFFANANAQKIEKQNILGDWACDSMLIQGMAIKSDEANLTVDNLHAFTFFSISENELNLSSMRNQSKGSWSLVENKILWSRKNRVDTFVVALSNGEQLTLEQYNRNRKVNIFYLFRIHVQPKMNVHLKKLAGKWKAKQFIPSSLGVRDTLNDVFYKNSWANFDSIGTCQITVGAVMVQGHYWLNKSGTRLVFRDLAGYEECIKLKLQDKKLIFTRPENAGGSIGNFKKMEFYLD